MLKRFISYYKPHKLMFTLDMLASLLMSVIALCHPEITRRIYRDYVGDKNIKMVLILGGVLLGLYILRMLLKFFVQYYGHVIGVKMQAKMRSDMFSHLQELPYSYYDEHETGKIMSRMTNDLQNVSELAHHGPENFFICGVTIIGSFVYLLFVNWLLALIVFSCVPFLIAISLIMRKKMNNAFTETRKSVAQINASLESSITGIRVTKAFTNKDRELEKFEGGNVSYVKSRSKAYKAMGLFSSSTGLVVDIFNVVLLVAGGILSIKGVIDTGVFLTFVISVGVFMNPLTTLIAFVEQMQDGITGFRRFVEIMDEHPEVENENALDDVLLEGELEFKNVSFSYATTENVLKNVSFNVKKGETIALVGESGGGKTTICHLIPNFYKATDGEILIDGHNINDLSFKTLRRQIGIVQQDVFLFNGTIKENILYGRLDATDEEVIEAAKKANIYDYILTLEDGFDTQIGERGVKLSGGQKQRLSIARVFLKNPPILILDEATSALDNTTEILIQGALNDLAKGRTTIVVAHRLSTIKNADRIMVINGGEVVEDGNHDQLMKLNGIYHNLYSLQFRTSDILEFPKVI